MYRVEWTMNGTAGDAEFRAASEAQAFALDLRAEGATNVKVWRQMAVAED
jgi:hypothetical protein